MKKILAVLLSVIMMLGSFTASAFAQETSAMQQQVLEKIKDRIGNTDEYDDFTVNVYNDNYMFHWSNEYKSLDVSATSDGFITGYSLYNHNDSNEQKTFTDMTAAKANAQSLISALNPGFSFTLESTGNTSSPSFIVQRTENGIPVAEDRGYVDLTSDGKSISNFNINYTSGYTFTPATNVISKEEAQKAYMDKLGIKLIYKVKYSSDERENYIAYVPNETNKYINALTGNVFDYSESLKALYSQNSYMGNGASSADMAAEESMALSESEIAEFEKIAGLMSKDEIDSYLRNINILDIDNSYSLKNFSVYHDSMEDKYYATLYYETSDGENGKNITLNAATGDITSYYSYYSEENEKSNFTQQEAESKAKDAFSVLAGKRGNEYKMDETSLNNYGFTSSYTRYIDSVECSMDTAYLSFNSDGKLESFNINYSTNSFPDASKAISKEKAEEIIFSEVPYYVSYMADYANKKFVPVYTFGNNNITLNAITEEFVYPISSASDDLFNTYYKDIDDSYAKDIIIRLAQYGIYFEDTNFKPNEPISEKDFIAMIYSAKRGNGEAINEETYEKAYEYAKNAGIMLPNDYPQDIAINRDTLSREMASKYIIRMLGLEDVAKLNIYSPQFKDVTENAGYSAILSGFGIMSGDGNGNFNPKAQLTRQDAAIVLYKALTI